MMLRRTVLSLGLVLPFAGSPRPARAGAEAPLGDDGLHKQPWFLDSFLEMGPDLEAAAAEGRGLMVLIEQRGCPYCRELHKVNFSDAALVQMLTERFDVVQLDLWGAREAVDFDGEAMEERALVQKWGVVFTPTVLLFPADTAGAASRAEAEAFRMPGYFKPFHFQSGVLYAAEGHWREKPFQRYLQERLAELEAQGIAPDVW